MSPGRPALAPDVATVASDRELLRDASAICERLARGPAAHDGLELRGELLAAVRELARRWHMAGQS